MKKLIITGNVGNDAVVVAKADGTFFAKFDVAVAVGTKAAPKTDWVEVLCNGALVEVAKNHVKKGGKVLVDGFPQASAWIKDGVAMPKLKLYAGTLELLSRATNDGDVEVTEPIESEDIPF